MKRLRDAKKRILCIGLSFILCLSGMTVMPTLTVRAAGRMNLAQLQAKFPNGKYWNHAGNPGTSSPVNNQNGWTSTPCVKNKGMIGTKDQTCNGFELNGVQLSWQCMGYAEKLGFDFTGYNPRNNANGWATTKSVSSVDKLKPGDIVCYKNGGHSIFVTGVKGEQVYYTDCNSDGHCVIRWNACINKSTLKSSFSHTRVAPYAIEGGAYTQGGAESQPAAGPSINNVSVTSVSSGHISLNFSADNSGLVRVVAVSKTTNETKTTDYTSGFDNINYTFSVSSMTNPGRDFYIRIYAYSTASGGNETLHAVTYGAPAGSVTLPELEIHSYMDSAPTFLMAGEQWFAGWFLGNREARKYLFVVNDTDEYVMDKGVRSDVAASFPDYPAQQSGFSLTVNATMFQNGNNTVAVRAYTSDTDYIEVYRGNLEVVKLDEQYVDWAYYLMKYNKTDATIKAIGDDAQKLIEDYYVRGISLGYSPNIGLDIEYFKKTNKDVVNGGYTTNEQIYSFIVKQMLTVSEPRVLSPFLNLTYYRDTNPDLWHLDAAGLWKHYLTFGGPIKENRLGNNTNEAKAMRNLYSSGGYSEGSADLKKNLGDGRTDESARQLWNHLMYHVLVRQERRILSSKFDINYYMNMYGLIDTNDAFWHYINTGYAAGEKYTRECAEASHKWDGGAEEKTATCISTGKKLYTCEACGKTKIETIEKAAHTVIIDEGVAATYTTAGKKEGSHCSVCKVVIKAQETIPPLSREEQTEKPETETAQKTGTEMPGTSDSEIEDLPVGTEVDTPEENPEEKPDGQNPEDGDIEHDSSEDEDEKKLEVGDEVRVGRAVYVITSMKKGNPTAAFSEIYGTAKKLVIPAAIKVEGVTYKVTEIGEEACYRNRKITSVKIGNNVTTIGDNAFNGCKKLQTVTIGTGVKKIGSGAFKGCSALKKITIQSKNLKRVGKNALKGISPKAKIKVPAKKVTKYKALLKGKGQGKKVKISK